MIPIKTSDEIRIMREACTIAATVLDQLARMVTSGMNTWELDQEARKLIESFGARSACFQYPGPRGVAPYPGYICLSVNDEIIHGIGSPRRVLNDGDIISLDVAVVHEGYIGDNARTIPVGQIDPEVRKLLDTTLNALHKGIEQARPGNRVVDISRAIQRTVEAGNYSVVREFVGHGVGRSMHEEPQIPNFKSPSASRDKLKPGMTLAIEPMVNMGRPEIDMLDDGWTAVTRDGSPAAHFEHTVLITRDGPEILTFLKN